MRVEITEVVHLEEQRPLTLAELADLARLSEAEVQEFVEVGVISAGRMEDERLSFGAECLVAARTASRVRQEFDLDLHSAAIVMRLLDRIRELEMRLRTVNR
jgi:MerR HTH family regulatory protein